MAASDDGGRHEWSKNRQMAADNAKGSVAQGGFVLEQESKKGQNTIVPDKTDRRLSSYIRVRIRTEETKTMPMIDVYAAADLFPPGADRKLAAELTAALLRAEGVANPGPTHTNNTGAYIHRMPPEAVNTAAEGSARTVRVQVVTPPGVLSRAGQKQLVSDATRIVAEACGDPTQVRRTWVLLTEAAEGGWGIGGTAFGKEEFAALAAKKA